MGFTFCNGNYVADKSAILPRTNAHLEIYVLTCKHHDTYELNPLESLDSSLSELFDMTIKAESLKSKYKSDILAKRELLIHLYRKLSPALTKPTYISDIFLEVFLKLLRIISNVREEKLRLHVINFFL